MDLIGGTPRAFLGNGANLPAWSPDGSRLVYVYKSDRDDPILSPIASAQMRAKSSRLAHQEQQSGLVARRTVDLLRPRTGAAGRDEHECVAPSILRRIAGAADQPARGGDVSGTARRAHPALYRARGGLVGAMALGARRRTQGHAQGQFWHRSIHVGIGQPRRASHRRDRCEPERESLAGAAFRSARR